MLGCEAGPITIVGSGHPTGLLQDASEPYWSGDAELSRWALCSDRTPKRWIRGCLAEPVNDFETLTVGI